MKEADLGFSFSSSKVNWVKWMREEFFPLFQPPLPRLGLFLLCFQAASGGLEVRPPLLVSHFAELFWLPALRFVTEASVQRRDKANVVTF